MSILLDLVSIKTSAQLLNVSRTQVYRLIDNSLIRSIKIDEKTFVLKSSIDEYIALNEQIDSMRKKLASSSVSIKRAS